MKPSETVFKLDALLRQIGTDFMPMAAEKKLDLSIVPSSLAVNTDRNLLRRLIQNLVSNAIKYTRSGRVLVGVRRRGELVELQVIDTGIGIATDKLNTVFREFTRLDEGAREAQGLGLGLSIVDRIARVLRLEIRIVPQGQGHALLGDPAGHRRARAAAQLVEARAGNAGGGMRSTGCRCFASTTIRASSTACACCWRAGAAACGRSPARRDSTAQRTICRRPTSCLPTIISTAKTASTRSASCGRGFRRRTLPAILVTADRSNEVRAAADAIDVPVINKPVKPAALRSMMTRFRRMATAAE